MDELDSAYKMASFDNNHKGFRISPLEKEKIGWMLVLDHNSVEHVVEFFEGAVLLVHCWTQRRTMG